MNISLTALATYMASLILYLIFKKEFERRTGALVNFFQKDFFQKDFFLIKIRMIMLSRLFLFMAISLYATLTERIVDYGFAINTLIVLVLLFVNIFLMWVDVGYVIAARPLEKARAEAEAFTKSQTKE